MRENSTGIQGIVRIKSWKKLGTEGIRNAQPVDKAICENGSTLPRFPSAVSIILIKPRLYKRDRKVDGAFQNFKMPPQARCTPNADSRDSNPHIHCPLAKMVLGSSVCPGSQQLSPTARLSQQIDTSLQLQDPRLRHAEPGSHKASCVSIHVCTNMQTHSVDLILPTQLAKWRQLGHNTDLSERLVLMELAWLIFSGKTL